MTPDEQSIVTLTRENTALKQRVADLEKSQLHAEIELTKAGVPSHFEDGNDSDSLSFNERVRILCEMHSRAAVEKATGLLPGPCLELAKQLHAEGHTNLPLKRFDRSLRADGGV